MRKMKCSGVEWIEEIPENWSIIPMKSMFSYSKGLPITKADLVEKGIPVISYGQIHSKKNTGIRIENEFIRYAPIEYRNTNPLSQASEGDILFADTSEDYDGIGNCIRVDREQEMYAGYHTIIARPKDSRFSKYWAFLFQTDSWRSQLRLQASGIKVFSITQRMLNGVSLIIPSLNDGVCIADYLDAKCAKIDALIAKQQEIIEKLKAYKLSVITEAVTKGLNPNVPMKDSGNEWIGKMPHHWNVVKLGMIFDFLGGYAFDSNEYIAESTNQIIRIGNVKNDRLVLEANPVYISDDLAISVEKFRIQAGCILFTMTGTKGKRDYFFTHLVSGNDVAENALYLNQRVGCLIPRANICAGYYNYLLKDNHILDSIFLYETGTANQGNLGIESIRRTRLHLPPLEEQKIIYRYLNKRCSKIDALIEKKQRVIEKLSNYKKSLIYEVVTGKREV